jgi:hypothetical protein
MNDLPESLRIQNTPLTCPIEILGKLPESTLPNSDKGPIKLFVGGLHRNEGEVTRPILEELAKSKFGNGKSVVVPDIGGKRYISTLMNKYYQTQEGRKLLSLIREYKPKIYFELHAYRPFAYKLLTDPERKEKKGVPPLVELEKGVLMGSVSPIIRFSEFRGDDLCFLLEVPKYNNEGAKDAVLDLLRVASVSGSRFELLGEYMRRYPGAMTEGAKLYYEYFYVMKGGDEIGKKNHQIRM